MAVDARSREMSRLELVRASLWIFFTLAGTTMGLTWLYLGMRSVMEVGGACAEGGAFEIAVPCPEGVPLLVVGGLLGGLAMCGMYAFKVARYQVPSFLAFAWPALFLSLGWNFLEFGLNPPGDQSGVVWGWLVCAFVFALMGGLPLLVVIKPVYRRFRGVDSTEAWQSGTSASAMRARMTKRSSISSRRVDEPAERGPAPVATGDDFVSRLERLKALHVAGGLDDDEYERAKEKLLREGSP